MSRTKVALTDADLEAVVRAAFGAATRLVAVHANHDGMYNAVSGLELSGPNAPAKAFIKIAPPDDVPVLDYEANLLRTELDAMAAARAAGVALVPEVLFEDFSHTLVDRNFALLQALPGRPLYLIRQDLTAADRLALRRQIGAMAAGFSRVQGPAFGYPGNTRLQAPTWPEAMRRMFAALLADAERFGAVLPLSVATIRDQVEAALPLLGRVAPTPRLVHYDLWDGNILVEPGPDGWRISALLDWERAFWGDPLAEVVSLLLFSGAEEHRAVLEGWTAAGGAPADDSDAQRRLALYRAYLWLIMIVEAPSRGHGGSILLPTSAAAGRLVRHLAQAATRPEARLTQIG